MLWIKAFHVIAVICWFCGLLYLPRLFVYHANTTDQPGLERFKIMEYKLFHYIMTPAAILSLALGVWLLTLMPFYLKQGWLHAKLSLVGLLVVYHLYCGHLLKQFAKDKNTKTHIFYRCFNELPSALLIAIVILVVVKPF